MKAFSIMRHAKIKAGKHLVGTGLHNARGADTPNAVDVPGLEPVFMLGSSTPHHDVMAKLKAVGIGKLKGGKSPANVAVEVMGAASPEWWASKGWVTGETPSPETRAVIDDWAGEFERFLRDTWGDRLVSIALHLDEATPHVQALFCPLVYREDKREKKVPEVDDAGIPTGNMIHTKAWRLSTESCLRGPKHLKQLQSELARRMARFGLVRGADRETGTTWHKPLKEWQEEQAAAAVQIGSIIMEQEQARTEAVILRNSAGSELDMARDNAAEIIDTAKREARQVEEDAGVKWDLMMVDRDRMLREDAAEREAMLKAAKVEADRIIADAKRKAKEQADFELAVEAERRRKDDSSRALELRVGKARDEVIAQRKVIDAEWLVIEAERAEVATLKSKLAAMIVKVETLLRPIVAMADRWRTASPLARHAMGAKGTEAVSIAESVEVQTLMKMREGQGSAR